MLRGTGAHRQHSFNRIEQQLHIPAAFEHGTFCTLCHGVELADTPGIEGDASAADPDNRLKGLAEQVCTNHLEALFHRRSVFLFILLHGLALQLRLDALFHIAQLT